METNDITIFQTPGTIDPISWELMGISAKNDSSAIGYFGTGLKYAIAILLRTGHRVTINTPDNHYAFSLETTLFRDKKFDLICCNGKRLGYTTEFGQKWQVWQAYRELFCNTLDEDGTCFTQSSLVDAENFIGQSTQSRIVVEGLPLVEAHKNHNDYFVDWRQPLADTGRIRVYEGNGAIYYKGVKIHQLEQACYSYELLENIELTEDRTLASVWSARYDISRGLTQIDHEEVIRTCITAESDSLEGGLDYDELWSETFLKVASEVWKETPALLNRNVSRRLLAANPDLSHATRQTNSSEEELLSKAVEILELAGYPLSCGTCIVETTSDECLSFLANNTIHLSPEAFEHGIDKLCCELFRNYTKALGFSQGTQYYEDWLIEQVVVLAHQNQPKINLVKIA